MKNRMFVFATICSLLVVAFLVSALAYGNLGASHVAAGPFPPPDDDVNPSLAAGPFPPPDDDVIPFAFAGPFPPPDDDVNPA